MSVHYYHRRPHVWAGCGCVGCFIPLLLTVLLFIALAMI
jgi:hypothetical protein